MKKLKLLSLILLIIFNLTGCLSVSDIFNITVVESRAHLNAKNYIKNKYGFKPKIIECSYERVGGGPFPSNSPTGDAYVYMEDELGKEFTVYISGRDFNTDGYDNYQKDEIIEAVKEEFCNLLDVDDIKLEFSYGRTDEIESDDKYYI